MNTGMTGTPRLLVVDDDATIREMLEMVLESEGYEVVTAPHGEAAFVLLDQISPDVIILDMKMPVMDGWTFAREFHARYDGGVPILVLTAADDARRRAEEIGANGWIGKPFDVNALLEHVRLHVGAA